MNLITSKTGQTYDLDNLTSLQKFMLKAHPGNWPFDWTRARMYLHGALASFEGKEYQLQVPVADRDYAHDTESPGIDPRWRLR